MDANFNKCNECKHDIPPMGNFCPNCGLAAGNIVRKKRSSKVVCTLIILAVFFGVLSIALTIITHFKMMDVFELFGIYGMIKLSNISTVSCILCVMFILFALLFKKIDNISK